MSRRIPFFIALLAAATLVTAGCKKKPPAPPAAPEQTTTHTEPDRPSPPPAPSTDNDRQASPWEGTDLEAMQMQAEREGLLGEVLFAYDSSALDTGARERLSRNARFLTDAGKALTITIEGHTDDRGTNQYNIALGERRANAARDYLISLGVGSQRLRTISFGEERGKCNTAAESCWRQNRRAYFRITGNS